MTGSSSSGSARESALAAFLALLAERSFETISLADVATRAGVTLAELRGAYGSTFDILAAFLKDTDAKVLASGEVSGEAEEIAGEPARDRLFDVLMRRLDVLAPHKAALRSLAASARRNPVLALGLNRLAARSQQWMLAAAGIETAGLGGAVRAQGLVVVFARVLRVFLNDEDPGLARTMAALDRELAKGERALGLVRSACRLASCGGRRKSRRRERPAEPEPDAAVTA